MILPSYLFESLSPYYTGKHSFTLHRYKNYTIFFRKMCEPLKNKDATEAASIYENNGMNFYIPAVVYYCAFRQVEHEVRNRQPPAVRVGNKGYTKKPPNMVE